MSGYEGVDKGPGCDQCAQVGQVVLVHSDFRHHPLPEHLRDTVRFNPDLPPGKAFVMACPDCGPHAPWRGMDGAA